MTEITQLEESEANAFAFELLMPFDLVVADIRKGIDMLDDRAIEKIARKYRVPLTVMAMRLRDVAKEISE